MKKIKKFILNRDNEEKQNIIWNMVATISNSFQSMLLVLILTRMDEVVAASYITIAFSVANLFMTIGKFGIRSYQVTDIKEKFDFRVYVKSRIFTTALMAICCVFYGLYSVIFISYSVEKLLIVLLICIYKMIESVEDVYHGRLQQIGALCVASKIWAIRNIIFIVEFFVLFLVCNNLLITVVISLVTSLVLAIWLNLIPLELYGITPKNGEGTAKNLITNCISIAIAAFLLMYISNAPKYIIDTMVSDEEQTKINILMMVIYVVTLLSNFMFNPVLNKLAILYHEGKMSVLVKKITMICFGVISIVVFGLIFAEIIGRKLLGIIFNVSLEEYSRELLLIIVSGGIIALINFFYLIVIMFRKQKVFFSVFSVGALVLAVFGKNVLQAYKLIGLCVFYDIIISITLICLIITSIYSISLKKGDKL